MRATVDSAGKRAAAQGGAGWRRLHFAAIVIGTAAWIGLRSDAEPDAYGGCYLGAFSSSEREPDELKTPRPTSISRTTIVIRDVAAGSVLIIGSLDLTGARHHVEIRPLDCESKESPLGSAGDLAVVRITASEIEAASNEWTNARRRQSRRPARRELQFTSHRAARPHPRQPDGAVSFREPVKRRFIAPRFDQQGSFADGIIGVLLARNDDVAVFVDERCCAIASGVAESSSFEMEADEARTGQTGPSFHFGADQVCQLLSDGILDHVTEWIGSVADLDCDQRLTFFITDLDRHPNRDGVPILGCVRESDFLGGTDSALADVIYVDAHALESPDLAELLVHEVSHAAVYSAVLERLARSDATGRVESLPGWLNEVAAHVVEANWSDDTEFMADRQGQFESCSGNCPIVASHRDLGFDIRRGGCRAAGLSFFASSASAPDSLRKLLRETSAGCSQPLWAELLQSGFREWSVRTGYPLACELAGSEVRKCTVFGTAFKALRIANYEDAMLIETDADATIQITVISPGI